MGPAAAAARLLDDIAWKTTLKLGIESKTTTREQSESLKCKSDRLNFSRINFTKKKPKFVFLFFAFEETFKSRWNDIAF